MLECPVTEIREASVSIFEYCISGLFKFESAQQINGKINSLITNVIQLLDKAVIDLCKNSHEYFTLLYKYANMVCVKYK